MLRLLAAAALAAAAVLGAGREAAAQPAAPAWPTRPLQLVVPYPPGGPVDATARLVAPRLQEALGQPVVVENRAGAGGNLGAEVVARSAPDGHTLLMGTIATHAINPALYPRIAYDPLRDFVHVALLVQVPNVLVVNNDLPVRDVESLVRLARRQPGRLDFASGSSGSTGHLAGELFKQLTGTYMVHIPYRGAAPAMADLLAGRVHLMFDNLASALPQVRAGRVRALAVTTRARSDYLPGVPTLEESGLSGFHLTTWWGLMAPAGTPAMAVQRLAVESDRMLQALDLRERLRAMGSEPPEVRSPEAFSRFVERELKTYAALVRRAGATPD